MGSIEHPLDGYADDTDPGPAVTTPRPGVQRGGRLRREQRQRATEETLFSQGRCSWTRLRGPYLRAWLALPLSHLGAKATHDHGVFCAARRASYLPDAVVVALALDLIEGRRPLTPADFDEALNLARRTARAVRG